MLKHALRGKPGYHNFRVLSFCSSSYFCQHATHFLLKKKLFDLLKSTLIIHARTPTYTLHVRDKNPISYSYVNSLATHPACALHCISYATLETFLIFLYIWGRFVLAATRNILLNEVKLCCVRWLYLICLQLMGKKHLWMLHDVVVVWRRLWPGPVATHRNRVTKRAQHVAPNNVAICCVQMLRSLGQVLRRRSSVSYCMLEFPASKLVFVCFKKNSI